MHCGCLLDVCQAQNYIHQLLKHTLFGAPPLYSIHLMCRPNCFRLLSSGGSKFEHWPAPGQALQSNGPLPCTPLAMATAPLKLTQSSNMQLAAPPHLPYSSVATMDEQACSPTPSRTQKPAQCKANPVPGNKAILHQTCICHCKRLCEINSYRLLCLLQDVGAHNPRTKQLL